MTGQLNVQDADFPTSTPSSTTYGNRVQLIDGSGESIGYLQPIFTAAGERGMEIVAARKVNGSNFYQALQLRIDASGNRSVYMNYPATWRDALNLSTKTLSFTKASFIASNSNIHAFQCGPLVLVNFWPMYFSSAPTNGSTIISGLPIQEGSSMCAGHLHLGGSSGASLIADVYNNAADGKLKCNLYSSSDVNKACYGQIMYITSAV